MDAMKGLCQIAGTTSNQRPHTVFSPVALPRPKVSVEVCSSAPSEVEASKLAEASLSASPDQGRDQDAAG